MKTPSIKELYTLCRGVKSQVRVDDECRAFEDDTIPGIQLTVGCNDDGNWNYQTGDNSYTGGAYGFRHWAVVGVYRDSNCLKLAKEIQRDLRDLMAS